MENQIIIILKKTLRGKKHLVNMNTPVQQGKVQSQLHGVSKHRYQRQKKANAQLDNQVGNGTLGHKTIGQTAINGKVSTAKGPKHN